MGLKNSELHKTIFWVVVRNRTARQDNNCSALKNRCEYTLAATNKQHFSLFIYFSVDVCITSCHMNSTWEMRTRYNRYKYIRNITISLIQYARQLQFFTIAFQYIIIILRFALKTRCFCTNVLAISSKNCKKYFITDCWIVWIRYEFKKKSINFLKHLKKCFLILKKNI